MQNHFQKVNERCDRLEKLILKQITEQRYQQNIRRGDLGLRSRTMSVLTLADADPGFSNELYRDSSPIETESET